jgi:CHAP domain
MQRRALLQIALSSSLSAISRTGFANESAPQRVLAELLRITRNLRTTSYDHSTHINERIGRYDWDCSAMAAFVLRRTAPRAMQTVSTGRAVASDFYRVIARSPVGRFREGWQRIARISDALPGDVLAWQRPRWFPSTNTGHVAFVVGVPSEHALGQLVRIVDSTRIAHQNDTRETQNGQSGFGQGTLLVTTDPVTGEGTGYGWIGGITPPDWVIPTPVVIGRVAR